jgi:hypothetical protein
MRHCVPDYVFKVTTIIMTGLKLYPCPSHGPKTVAFYSPVCTCGHTVADGISLSKTRKYFIASQ